MPKFMLNYLRQRAANQVVAVGGRLRKLYAYRAGLDVEDWPDDVAAADTQIEGLERKRDRLIDFIKDTS